LDFIGSGVGTLRVSGGEALRDRVERILREHEEVARGLYSLAPDIARAAQAIQAALRGGGRVLLCGNGGSAADAQHIAAELVGRFARERGAWPALALNTNGAVLTALGNDYGFDKVFARQVEALGEKGDVLVALSTSGRSTNVLLACDAARSKGMYVLGLTGADGGELKSRCNLCLCVPSKSTPRVQEMHILIGHILCDLVEQALC